MVLGVVAFTLGACSPNSLVDVAPSTSIVDVDAMTTPAGAVRLYNTAITRFATAFGGGSRSYVANYVGSTGLFTDEFARASAQTGIDERNMSDVVMHTPQNQLNNSLYTALHQARIAASQARQALKGYAPDAPTAWQGRMAAMEGYTVLMLAEYFCSGIPLSEVPLTGDMQFSPGVATPDLLARAVALFDTAIVLSQDSSRFLNLARVGKARALLNLGRFADAAQTAHDVPDGFVYDVEFSSTVSGASNVLGSSSSSRDAIIQNKEGGNGMPWLTANDPRVPIANGPSGRLVQGKYTSATAPIVLASAVEARLIEAEADLADSGTQWLTILNTLRTSTGGVAGLAALPDSGLTPPAGQTADDARLDEIMGERAFWLYATGHRQGDLRRLLKVYHRNAVNVYPSGPYDNPIVYQPVALYGDDVVMLPPQSEQDYNPVYTGCEDMKP
jgi:hypothetical protein